jgi:phosphoglycolate phosphatase
MFGKAAKLRQALRQCAVQPPEAIYIGDEIRDAEAAAKAEIAFGAVAWGQHGAEILGRQKPAQIFSSVQEIADALC